MEINNTIDAKKRALVALRASRCNVTKACEAADIARPTFYMWCEKDEDFKAAVEQIKDERVDFFEQQLIRLMEGAEYESLDVNGEIRTLRDKPNPTAVIFGLKTLGKSRGYVEKTEIEMNVAPVQVTLDKSDI